jgi:hypothetical protein
MDATHLRPLVITSSQSRQTLSAGASGDVSVGVATTTLWFDASDHSKTYGQSRSGYWQWNFNLFPTFAFPGCASFYPALGGTVQSGSIQMDLELLDGSASILTSASMVVNYSVDLSTVPGFTYSVSAGAPSAGSEKIDAWNAVRVRSTCSNTNLNQVLNYGPLGSFATPSAYVTYPLLSTFTDRYQ